MQIVSDVFKPSRFESKGSITLRGVNINYHTVCEDNVFYDETGKPLASVFSYSYFRDGVADIKKRPVIFAFNGGPGTSSMMVHIGFLGTTRIKYGNIDDGSIPLPPYESCDNPQCLLDIADLVLVDPVGTGLGRLLDEESYSKFYGIEEDAEALLAFIQMWLARYNRWQSPKYLCGESYGCTRAAVAAGLGSIHGSARAYSMAFDGIIFIGNTVTNSKYFAEDMKIYPAVLAFPTLAAANWYHNHPSDQSVEDFVAEAKRFADTEYLLALYRGESLVGEEREHIIERVMYYTGVGRDYLVTRNLHLEDEDFRSEVARKLGKSVARLDARITRPLYEKEVEEHTIGRWDDPSEGKYNPFFQSVLLGELFPKLGIKDFDRTFVSTAHLDAKWNHNTKERTTAQHLAAAMRRIPGMRAFFINGWYDICTQIGILYYALDHSSLPMDRVFVKGYPSGHMAYLGEDNIEAVTSDMRTFIMGQDPTRK